MGKGSNPTKDLLVLGEGIAGVIAGKHVKAISSASVDFSDIVDPHGVVPLELDGLATSTLGNDVVETARGASSSRAASHPAVACMYMSRKGSQMM